MMNNGMTFGLEGPNITGWWVNPQTGDKFNAVDTYFEDNQLLIKTADGRLLKYNQIQNYVQTDKPDSFAPSTAPAKPADDIPDEVLNEIEGNNPTGEGLLIPDDDIFGDRPSPLGNMYKGVESATSKTTDYDIIARALSGKSTLELRGDIRWVDFPKREIEMLIEVMNIPEEDIIQYFINNVSLEDVKKSIQDSIRYYIDRVLHPLTGLTGPSESNIEESTDIIEHNEESGKTTKEPAKEKSKKTKKKVND